VPSGYHLGCKTKTPIDSHTVGKSIGADSGSGLTALALVLAHIHDRFASAMLAEQREINKRGRR
jgi:hypothetical protein